MVKYLVLLFLAAIALTAAKPVPDYEGDGQDILESRDGRYEDIPAFWYQRPLEGNDGGSYYGASDGGYRPAHHHHHHGSLPIYESAGAGWGR